LDHCNMLHSTSNAWCGTGSKTFHQWLKKCEDRGYQCGHTKHNHTKGIESWPYSWLLHDKRVSSGAVQTLAILFRHWIKLIQNTISTKWSCLYGTTWIFTCIIILISNFLASKNNVLPCRQPRR
jgi:hypothetical protein